MLAVNEHLLLEDVCGVTVLQNLPEHLQGLGIINAPDLLDERKNCLLRTRGDLGGSTNEDLEGWSERGHV